MRKYTAIVEPETVAAKKLAKAAKAAAMKSSAISLSDDIAQISENSNITPAPTLVELFLETLDRHLVGLSSEDQRENLITIGELVVQRLNEVESKLANNAAA